MDSGYRLDILINGSAVFTDCANERKKEDMKMKRKPIEITLKYTWTFDQRDHLPDDFSGTRKEAIRWFKDDVATNLSEYIGGASSIIGHLEAK